MQNFELKESFKWVSQIKLGMLIWGLMEIVLHLQPASSGHFISFIFCHLHTSFIFEPQRNKPFCNMWDFSWYSCYSFHPLFWSSVFIYHTSNHIVSHDHIFSPLFFPHWDVKLSSLWSSPHSLGFSFSAALVLMLLSNPLKKPIWKLHWLTRRNPQRTLSTWICLIVREEKPMKKKMKKRKANCGLLPDIWIQTIT